MQVKQSSYYLKNVLLDWVVYQMVQQSTIYECTVMDSNGIGTTLWRGGAFSCSGSPPNAINLVHSGYVSGTSATCGDLSAMSIGVDGTNYTSRLTVTASTGLDGTMIDCTISNVVLEGSDTIRVGGKVNPIWSHFVE